MFGLMSGSGEVRLDAAHARSIGKDEIQGEDMRVEDERWIVNDLRDGKDIASLS